MRRGQRKSVPVAAVVVAIAAEGEEEIAAVGIVAAEVVAAAVAEIGAIELGQDRRGLPAPRTENVQLRS